MNILFVMPLALPAYLFQLAALSAFLKSKGHNVRYKELVVDGKIKSFHLESLKATIEKFKPDIIGFSSYEMSFPWIEEISDYIKSIFPEIPIVVGGYYVTLSPEEVLNYPSVDIVCIGEGEYPLLEFLDSISSGKVRKDIQNLWFKENGRIIKNTLRQLIVNLDELPFVDRELFTSDNRRNGILEMMASRGCLFDCTNCSNHALKKIYSGKGPYLRQRSAENVLDEIEECLKRENFKIVEFEDDMFTANKKWLYDFCDKYKRSIKLPFICNIRPESGKLEILSLLKEAGCMEVSIGIEAGDQRIRQKVLDRDMSDALIIAAFKNAKKLGVKRKSFNMVGLPYETPFSLWKTIWLNLKIAPDAVQTSVYYPFKGTLLGDECYRKGWVDFKRKKQLRLYANDSILNLPGVSRWLIKLAKWVNSASVLRSGNFSIIKIALSMFRRSLYIRGQKTLPFGSIALTASSNHPERDSSLRSESS